MAKVGVSSKVLITLPQDLLVELDIFAEQNRYSRSELIRHAIRNLLIKARLAQAPPRSTAPPASLPETAVLPSEDDGKHLCDATPEDAECPV